MRKLLPALAAMALLAGCGAAGEEGGYRRVSMKEAEALMGGDALLVDVRTEEEYAAGHIPGAVNLPLETIGEGDIPLLPDKEGEILVYCRSGRRSQKAAGKLAGLGYTGIVEIGGILDWEGETVTAGGEAGK